GVFYTHIDRPEPFAPGVLPRNSTELSSVILGAMKCSPSVIVDAPAFVGTEFVRQTNRLLVHLVDYSKDSDHPPIRIRVSSSLGTVSSAHFFSPNAAKAVSIQSKDGQLVV